MAVDSCRALRSRLPICPECVCVSPRDSIRRPPGLATMHHGMTPALNAPRPQRPIHCISSYASPRQDSPALVCHPLISRSPAPTLLSVRSPMQPPLQLCYQPPFHHPLVFRSSSHMYCASADNSVSASSVYPRIFYAAANSSMHSRLLSIAHRVQLAAGSTTGYAPTPTASDVPKLSHAMCYAATSRPTKPGTRRCGHR